MFVKTHLLLRPRVRARRQKVSEALPGSEVLSWVCAGGLGLPQVCKQRGHPLLLPWGGVGLGSPDLPAGQDWRRPMGKRPGRGEGASNVKESSEGQALIFQKYFNAHVL